MQVWGWDRMVISGSNRASGDSFREPRSWQTLVIFFKTSGLCPVGKGSVWKALEQSCVNTIFFFHIGIKSHLREEGLILAPSSEGFSLWWTSHGGEGTRQLGTLLPQLVSYLFPFLFIPELQLMGWYGPHSGWVFCPQLNLSGNTLIETSPRLFKI